MSSFFIKGKQVNGVKRAKYAVKEKKKKIKKQFNEEISSSEDEDVLDEKNQETVSSDDDHETVQEKKLRLAKIYLEEIAREEKARLDTEEIDSSVISKRLKEDYLKEAGKLRLSVADKYKTVINSEIATLKCRNQRNCVTCMCISQDDKYLYSGSKDGVVVKYSLTDKRKVGVIPFVRNQEGTITGHSCEVLSIAISTDRKFLATGDKQHNIHIWNPETLTHIKTLTGHKGPIFGLCFKRDSHTLYSCSKDKTAKVWSLDEMAYVETLFGHQDNITSIDAIQRDRAVTCGGRDLRIWKIPEETQLIFNGHNGNIDCVKLINEENFVSCGDDGQICLWSLMRKKPLHAIANAHGVNESNEEPHWVCTVTALLNTDVIASGSMDGLIRVWKLHDGFKSSSLMFQIPVEGFVNCLNFTSDGKYLIAAVSREYRLGRWDVVKNAKNCIYIIPFRKED